MRLYLKRGCIKMCKHAETFHADTGYKLAIVNFDVFKIEISDTLMKWYFHENEALLIPTFYMNMNNFNIVFRLT